MKGMKWFQRNGYCKQSCTVCDEKFRELLEWCPNVTIRTTYPGLDSLVKKKHLAARMSHLCTEIMSYPVTFKQVGIPQGGSSA